MLNLWQENFEEINDARTQIFLEKYSPKSEHERLTCAKKLDGSMLPPCQRVLMQKLKRVRLISRRWASSILAHLPYEIPKESGWFHDDTYKISCYEGDATPPVLDVVCDSDTENLDAVSEEEG